MFFFYLEGLDTEIAPALQRNAKCNQVFTERARELGHVFSLEKKHETLSVKYEEAYFLTYDKV